MFVRAFSDRSHLDCSLWLKIKVHHLIMVAEPGPAEQAERHDGMAEYMKMMGEQPSEPSVEERNMLSLTRAPLEVEVQLGASSPAWSTRKINGNKRQAAYTREHAVTVEVELQKICDGTLTLMDQNLVSFGEFRRVEDVLQHDEGRLPPIPCKICHRRCDKQGCRGRPVKRMLKPQRSSRKIWL